MSRDLKQYSLEYYDEMLATTRLMDHMTGCNLGTLNSKFCTACLAAIM